jgi:hypothetical protein
MSHPEFVDEEKYKASMSAPGPLPVIVAVYVPVETTFSSASTKYTVTTYVALARTVKGLETEVPPPPEVPITIKSVVACVVVTLTVEPPVGTGAELVTLRELVVYSPHTLPMSPDAKV